MSKNSMFLLIFALCSFIIIGCKPDPVTSTIIVNDNSSSSVSSTTGNVNLTENAITGKLYQEKLSGITYYRFGLTSGQSNVRYDWFINGVYIEDSHTNICEIPYTKPGTYEIACVAYVQTDTGYVTSFKCATKAYLGGK